MAFVGFNYPVLVLKSIGLYKYAIFNPYNFIMWIRIYAMNHKAFIFPVSIDDEKPIIEKPLNVSYPSTGYHSQIILVHRPLWDNQIKPKPTVCHCFNLMLYRKFPFLL